jgi:hypothetical protein
MLMHFMYHTNVSVFVCLLGGSEFRQYTVSVIYWTNGRHVTLAGMFVTLLFERQGTPPKLQTYIYIYMCVCVCVCV